MADASALGIHPPHTVRIDMGGWVQNWPWECVEVEGDQVVIRTIVAMGWSEGVHTCRRIVFYPYEHAHQLADDSWIFHGREDFTIEAGPPQAPSMDTAGPQ